jgi:hypothetical protein
MMDFPPRGGSGPDGGPSTWLIPAAAALLVVSATGLWLARQVSVWADGGQRPGSPLAYLVALTRGRAPWPTALGWAALALAATIAGAGAAGIAVVISRRRGRRHRADRAVRFLAPRTDRQRLTPRARGRESARLVPGVPDWPGTPLGRMLPGHQQARCGPEDVSVDVWGPRAGKTSRRVIPSVLDAPGPVLATTNKRDVSDATMALRAKTGPVWLFDPQGLATDGAPTFVFDPLRQVKDVSAAQKLAAIFEASTREPGARTDAQWDTAGRDLLAWLFLAAAAHGRPIGQIWEWLSNPDDATPAFMLREAGHDGPATAVEGVLGQPDKMRGSTYGTAQRMARALVNPKLLAWVTPGPALPLFDAEAFPASTGTLYALSREGEGSGGPFVAALTAHTCEAAERLAASHPSGRLEIPLVVELDEAANIVRWPELPKLYSHYGSRGILLHAYLQSWTQGAEAWGEYGMRTLWSAATIRVLGAGVADQKFLAEFSELIGYHDEWIRQSVSTGRYGDRQTTRSVRRERTLESADLASLPKNRAVVFTAGSRPVVIETQPWMSGPHAADIRAALADLAHRTAA